MGGGVSSHLLQENDSLKSNADKCFSVGQNDEAIYWYTLALNESISSDNVEAIAVLYSNRSAAYNSNLQYDKAFSDALQVIEGRPHWSKGYYRAAISAFNLKRIVTSKGYLATALALSPNDETLLKLQDLIESDDNAAVHSHKGIGWAYSWYAYTHVCVYVSLYLHI
jgi:tetratricopeptide (TPR) repeat protein